MKQKANQALNIIYIVFAVTILVLVVVIFSGKEEVEKSNPQLELGVNMSDNDYEEVNENLELVKTWRKPAIFMQKADIEGFSKFGGLPMLPDDVEWPHWNEKPLSFLAQIDLSEIPENCERNGLPDKGILYVFYENTDQTWGMYPEDKGSWKIIYSIKSIDELKKRNAPKELDAESIFNEKYISFKSILTYPPDDDERINELEKEDDYYTFDYYDTRMEVYEDKPIHHFWGYPTPIQGSGFEFDAEMTTNAEKCEDYAEWDEDKKNEFIKKANEKWVMLLHLDSDEEVGFCWGDCGILYFMITKEDLKNLNFDNVWMLLQCG